MTSDPSHVSLAAVPGSVAVARDHVEGILARAGVESSAAFDVVLATSEMVTNAVEASEEGGEIDVDVRVENDEVTIHVGNISGRPLPPVAAWGVGDALRRRGRGLGIVAKLASRLELDEDDSRVTITAVFETETRAFH